MEAYLVCCKNMGSQGKRLRRIQPWVGAQENGAFAVPERCRFLGKEGSVIPSTRAFGEWP